MTKPTEDGKRDGHTFQLRRRLMRACAVQLLYQLDLGDDWELNDTRIELFWQQLEENGEMPPILAKPEALRRQVRDLVEAVVAQRAELDAQLAAAATAWPLARMNAVDRNILRLGLHEIRYCDEVPAAVAINEAIELAREYGDTDSPAFVNGVLDALARQS